MSDVETKFSKADNDRLRSLHNMMRRQGYVLTAYGFWAMPGSHAIVARSMKTNWRRSTKPPNRPSRAQPAGNANRMAITRSLGRAPPRRLLGLRKSAPIHGNEAFVALRVP